MGRRGKVKDKVEAATEAVSDIASQAQEVLENGAAKMNGSLNKTIDHLSETQENIFLFIPNIIGTKDSKSLSRHF